MEQSNKTQVRAVPAYWHKIATMLMMRAGLEEVVLTKDDIERMKARQADGGLNIIMEEQEDGLHVRLITEAQARAKAKEIQATQQQLNG